MRTRASFVALVTQVGALVEEHCSARRPDTVVEVAVRQLPESEGQTPLVDELRSLFPTAMREGRMEFTAGTFLRDWQWDVQLNMRVQSSRNEWRGRHSVWTNVAPVAGVMLVRA